MALSSIRPRLAPVRAPPGHYRAQAMQRGSGRPLPSQRLVSALIIFRLFCIIPLNLSSKGGPDSDVSLYYFYLSWI